MQRPLKQEVNSVRNDKVSVGRRCGERGEHEVQEESLARLGLGSVLIFRAVVSFQAGPGTVVLGWFVFLFCFFFLLLAVVWNLVWRELDQ